MSLDQFIDQPLGQPEDGIGLALSGGGYRAMIFHVGALIRLNELALLRKIKRISSVSGGSITAAALGMSWKDLEFAGDVATNFDIFVKRMRTMAETTIDAGAIIGGILFPGSISDRVAKAYDETLFHGSKLAGLPDDAQPGNPRFVINATNVQTAALWRFSRNYMGDYRVGLVEKPDVSLAAAVAASSAFPPVLSPSELDIEQPVVNTPGADLHRPPFTKTAILSDGGVYDNLGLETIAKRYQTLLVSDAGQKIAPEEDPHRDWARHSLRVLDTVDNQGPKPPQAPSHRILYPQGSQRYVLGNSDLIRRLQAGGRPAAVLDPNSNSPRRDSDQAGSDAGKPARSPHELGIRHLRCRPTGASGPGIAGQTRRKDRSSETISVRRRLLRWIVPRRPLLGTEISQRLLEGRPSRA
jgi:NTE family protein